MSNMQAIMTVVLLSCGLVGILQAVNHVTRCKIYARDNLVLIDIVVTVMFLLVVGIVGLFTVYSGYNPMVIYASLALGVLVALILFVKIYIDHPRSTNRKMLLIFGIYFAVVAYVTIFARIGTVETSVRTELFDDLQQAFLQRDPAAAQHFILNVAMFLPFGYLIPATNPRYLRKWSFAMMGGLITSTVIEGCQLVFMLGQSDVDDILANTLGAVIGYILVRMVWQIQKNWQL